jgi:hypothetical protein
VVGNRRQAVGGACHDVKAALSATPIRFHMRSVLPLVLFAVAVIVFYAAVAWPFVSYFQTAAGRQISAAMPVPLAYLSSCANACP